MMISTVRNPAALLEGRAVLPGGWPASFSEIGELRRYAPGEVVYRAGDRADSVHVLLLGRAFREVLSESGKRSIFELHGPGDLLGIHGVLSGGEQPDTVRMQRRGAALVIARDDFLAFVDTHPAARRVMRDQLTRTYARDVERAGRMMERAEVRIRGVIFDLAKRFGVWGDVRGQLLDLGLTRREIGELTGTRLETVVRTLGRLKEAGLLTTDGKRFFIPRPERLIED